MLINVGTRNSVNEWTNRWGGGERGVAVEGYPHYYSTTHYSNVYVPSPAYRASLIRRERQHSFNISLIYSEN
jgi:hypothetical protein